MKIKEDRINLTGIIGLTGRMILKSRSSIRKMRLSSLKKKIN